MQKQRVLRLSAELAEGAQVLPGRLRGHRKPERRLPPHVLPEEVRVLDVAPDAGAHGGAHGQPQRVAERLTDDEAPVLRGRMHGDQRRLPGPGIGAGDERAHGVVHVEVPVPRFEGEVPVAADRSAVLAT